MADNNHPLHPDEAWWTIHAGEIRTALERVAAGDHPEVVWTELVAASEADQATVSMAERAAQDVDALSDDEWAAVAPPMADTDHELPTFPVDPEALDLLLTAIDTPDVSWWGVLDMLAGIDLDEEGELVTPEDPSLPGLEGAAVYRHDRFCYTPEDVMRSFIAEINRLRGLIEAVGEASDD